MEPLFSTSFPAADKLAWLAQIRKELKDDNAFESLRWHNEDGFIVEPYYTADDLADLPLVQIQSAQKQTTGWLNAPERRISDEKADNVLLRDTLRRGADALVLTLPPNLDLARLLDGIKLSDTPVFFRTDAYSNPVRFIQSLKSIAPYQLKGGLLTDAGPLTAQVTRLTADSPQFRSVTISSHDFHNAGATAAQELGFALARLAEVYDQLTDDGLTLAELIPKTALSVSVGTSYFLEVAKLRALRVLLARFAAAYQVNFESQPLPFLLHSQTSTFYDASATPYTNLLRATTEAMAAVIGGCDVLTVHPYNAILGNINEFSERIARNISVLLKEESYFDKVTDPSAGSYYIENLTNQLIETAWALFLNVEEMGGLVKAFASGYVLDQIDKSYQARVEAVKNGKVLVGVTKFRFDESLQPSHTNKPTQPSALTSLPDRRLTEPFE
ncbi:methylmalonyl-CoA mutase family protein [Spirosoma soli]|uniref:Methylmalonyl-CoA mutase family protein n=1 Tax=Spirosoma soli TaxID=1770529 RepID=A0ABW5M3Q7_9BACT